MRRLRQEDSLSAELYQGHRLLLRLWHTDSIEVSLVASGKRRTNKGEERSRSMFRTLEEHAEWFYGKELAY